MRRRWRKVLLIVGILALGLVIYDRVELIKWVGSTELAIEFVVADAETGRPIEGAVLLIHAESDHYLEKGKREYRLQTGSDGCVRYTIRSITTAGTLSGLGFTDTRSVCRPDWMILATAAGYRPCEMFHLSEVRFRQSIERLGPEEDRLIIPVQLHKSAP